MFKLPDRNYFIFSRMGCIGLAHHITEVVVNYSTLCGNMDAIVRNMLTGGEKLAYSFKDGFRRPNNLKCIFY